ncbi:zinc finger protein 280C-like [Centruroides sculpturatus]|uniref:zinc finger protein 280C-like n=1 Tax=Centruroides sculpturatus TaxID=218467 RepID=UPI000C6CA645|nr:zinc finger protein 280C-like [Centruroides sculpturatus]
MKHINAHIEIHRQCKPALSDLTQCKYCFRDFETPFSMQCHIEAVHLKKDSLVCRICNQEFIQFKNLLSHMKNFHIQYEMPYSCQLCHFRSSFHQDVILHFNEVHYGTDKMMCHYCLKIFHIKFSNVGLGFIQNYFYHIHKHQLKSVTRKCSKCCLIFLSVQELKEHRMYDHKVLVNRKGIHSIKSTFVAPSKEYLEGISNPNNSEIILNNANCEVSAEKSIKQLNNKLNSTYMEYNNKPSYLCCECGCPMALGHFGRFLICGCCPYSTNCHKAFVDHMIYKHTKLHTSGKNMAMDLKPVLLKYPMKCKCGFSSFEGNSIANHLVNCKKITCQITPSTKCMITVIKKSVDQFRYFDKDTKESDFSQSFLKMIKTEKNQGFKDSESMDYNEDDNHSTVNRSFNIKFKELSLSPVQDIMNENSQASPAIDDDTKDHTEFSCLDYKERNPDMLNALGLVRRTMFISDSMNNSRDTFDDSKSESLYFEVEVEEMDPSIHICEEIVEMDN